MLLIHIITVVTAGISYQYQNAHNLKISIFSKLVDNIRRASHILGMSTCRGYTQQINPKQLASQHIVT